MFRQGIVSTSKYRAAIVIMVALLIGACASSNPTSGSGVKPAGQAAGEPSPAGSTGKAYDRSPKRVQAWEAAFSKRVATLRVGMSAEQVVNHLTLSEFADFYDKNTVMAVNFTLVRFAGQSSKNNVLSTVNIPGAQLSFLNSRLKAITR
jgi:uncharacterized lipoprotein YmbA